MRVMFLGIFNNLPFLVGILIGEITLIISIILLSFFDGSLTTYEKLTIISSILTISVAFVAVLFTKLSLDQNKKQWLNNAFIKHEAEVLLLFRKVFYENKSAIYFYSKILDPQVYGYKLGKAPVLLRKEIVENFNRLVVINDFYNMNQPILRKYNLDRYLLPLTSLLEITQLLPEEDLLYVMVDSKRQVEEIYHLENREDIVRWFNILVAQWYGKPKNNKYFDIDELNENLLKDQDDMCAKHWEFITRDMSRLSKEIDLLTVYSEGSNQDWKIYSRIYKKIAE